MDRDAKRMAGGQSVYLRPDVLADLRKLLAITGREATDTVNDAVMRLVGEELGRVARAVEMER